MDVVPHPATWPANNSELLQAIAYNPKDGTFTTTDATGGTEVNYGAEQAVSVLKMSVWEQLCEGALGEDFLSELTAPDRDAPPPPMTDLDLSALDQMGDFI